jgi:hypothetical protein
MGESHRSGDPLDFLARREQPAEDDPPRSPFAPRAPPRPLQLC